MNTNTINDNVRAKLFANKPIARIDFADNGEITADIKAEMDNRYNQYVKALNLAAFYLEKYAENYFTSAKKNNIATLANQCATTAKTLCIDVSEEQSFYVAKMLCNIVHSFKATSNDTKHFTADFNGKAIKRPFEKALAEALVTTYIDTKNKRSVYLNDKAIEKQVKECVKAAEKSRTKALENQLAKLKTMTTAEHFATLEKHIRSHYVEIIPVDSEKPIDVPNGTVSTDITPTNEKTA